MACPRSDNDEPEVRESFSFELTVDRYLGSYLTEVMWGAPCGHAPGPISGPSFQPSRGQISSVDCAVDRDFLPTTPSIPSSRRFCPFVPQVTMQAYVIFGGKPASSCLRARQAASRRLQPYIQTCQTHSDIPPRLSVLWIYRNHGE